MRRLDQGRLKTTIRHPLISGGAAIPTEHHDVVASVDQRAGHNLKVSIVAGSRTQAADTRLVPRPTGPWTWRGSRIISAGLPITPRTYLGVYQVTAALGEGGMGQVFRARDTRLNRDVALKVLPESFVNDRPARAVHA